MLTEKYDKLVTVPLTPRQQMNSTSLPNKEQRRPHTGKYSRVTNSYDF